MAKSMQSCSIDINSRHVYFSQTRELRLNAMFYPQVAVSHPQKCIYNAIIPSVNCSIYDVHMNYTFLAYTDRTCIKWLEYEKLYREILFYFSK